MKSRIQKSIIAVLLCLMLAGSSSISVIQANASDLSGNTQEQGGQSIDSDKENSGDQGLNPGQDEKDSEQNDEEKQEEVSGGSEGENEDSNKDEEDADREETQSISVEYQAHVQTYGWQKTVKDGEVAGTSGQSKRVEAIIK